MPFTKMEGIGNDYVYIDARKAAPRALNKLAREISDRHFGVGSDGLILIRKSAKPGVKHRMQMFNSDGSESEMCGNGLRCVAKYLYDRKLERDSEFPIETGAGVLHVKVKGDSKHIARRVTINMGQPRLLRREIPLTGEPDGQVIGLPLSVGGREFKVTCVSMGNPHCVIFLPEPASKELVHGIGPLIENHEWFPRRTNVEFVYRESPTVLQQRTWERGAGETLACGTGASAVCVAANLNGLTGRKVKIKLLGGDLEMHWNEKDGCVYKTGPAREVFTGVWPA
ncbi:MAG: diaminopimelate epimerase [Planctomycetes bacterium]|nr:diaminopimelate epimerase [Planctomycetota bacterium]MCW8134144.1 diaminopimelate epimerase [Planctomycetota bacterium]